MAEGAAPTELPITFLFLGLQSDGSYGAKSYVVRCVLGFVPGPGGAIAL
jgi:hypothetical protein